MKSFVVQFHDSRLFCLKTQLNLPPPVIIKFNTYHMTMDSFTNDFGVALPFSVIYWLKINDFCISKYRVYEPYWSIDSVCSLHCQVLIHLRYYSHCSYMYVSEENQLKFNIFCKSSTITSARTSEYLVAWSVNSDNSIEAEELKWLIR